MPAAFKQASPNCWTPSNGNTPQTEHDNEAYLNAAGIYNISVIIGLSSLGQSTSILMDSVSATWSFLVFTSTRTSCMLFVFLLYDPHFALGFPFFFLCSCTGFFFQNNLKDNLKIRSKPLSFHLISISSHLVGPTARAQWPECIHLIDDLKPDPWGHDILLDGSYFLGLYSQGVWRLCHVRVLSHGRSLQWGYW